jgi:hypothetical protein
MLEKMILEPDDVNVKSGLKTELMWFKRAYKLKLFTKWKTLHNDFYSSLHNGKLSICIYGD